MAPELLDSLDAKELVDLATKVANWQAGKKLSDNKMVARFPDLGSTKTYTRIQRNDLAELDLDRQLANYRAVWANIEAIGDDRATEEELLADLLPAVELRRCFADVLKEGGNARFILVEGDTGLGKTSCGKLLAKRYGGRILWTEATVAWNDSPLAMMAAILAAVGIRELRTSQAERFTQVVDRLTQSRVAVVVDEAHHLGPRCLNMVKSFINQTPGEFILLAMPTLWRRLEHQAYEEVRQLTGNRLADRIKLALREKDIQRYVLARVPTAEDMTKEDLATVVRSFFERSPRHGNLGFVRDVCRRVNVIMEDAAGLSLETWSSAMAAEMTSRGN